jgi:hypothetical protein
MTPPIDTSAFPTGAPDIDYDDADDLAGLEELKEVARAYVTSWRSAQPIREMVLAFGLSPIVGVFLVRFADPIVRGELAGETEIWAISGDLPSMCFETDDARTPADALRLYCAIAEDWANTVLSGGDLSQCYPIPVAPTRELADMLSSRVRFLREEFIPHRESRSLGACKRVQITQEFTKWQGESGGRR